MDSTQPQPLTPEERLRDAIAGERADWHRVEVDPRDIVAVLASRAARTADPGGLRALVEEAAEHECWDGDNFIARPFTHFRAVLASETTAPTSDPVPLHLEATLPHRTFNLRNEADFAWLAGYFSGYHGVPGLLARTADPGGLREVASRIPGPEMEEHGSIDWRSWALSVRDAALASETTAPDPTGLCSAHQFAEDPSCRICYPETTAPDPEP